MSSHVWLIPLLLIAMAPAASAAKKAKSRPSTSEGPDLDAAARREIQCPKGFVAEKAAGPHLVVPDKPQKKAPKGRKRAKAADDDAKGAAKTRTLARRCVPDGSLAKPAADDGAKDRRTAAEALRD